jgi:hypothetical protein
MGRPKGSKNRSTIEREMRGMHFDVKHDVQVMQPTKSPAQMFDDMNNLSLMVAAGISPSLLVTGTPGLGKTYTIVSMLNRIGYTDGNEYVHVKGRSTAAGLFITLYENDNKLIVFDDCDSIFKDIDAVNLLKGALDSYDKRTIHWMSARPLKDVDGEPLPKSFEFTGRVIFISNLPIHRIDSAIRSRSFALDISLTAAQMLDRMQELLHEIEPNVTDLTIKLEALDALKYAYENFAGVELNFRSLIKAIRIRQMNFANWQDMVIEQVIASEIITH